MNAADVYTLAIRRPRRIAAGTRVALVALVAGLNAVPASSQTGTCAAPPEMEAGAKPAREEWALVADRDRICVYARRSTGSDVHEVMGITTVAATPARIYEVLADFERYPEFMPYVTTSKMLRKDGDTAWVFQQLALPFPISDRHYTIRLQFDASLAGGNRYRITWTLAGANEPSQQGTGERTLINNGYWDVRPLGGNTAPQVTYYVHTDPGGALPAFAVNMASTVSVPLVLEKLRARALGSLPANGSTPRE
jgi:hypothetical protein